VSGDNRKPPGTEKERLTGVVLAFPVRGFKARVPAPPSFEDLIDAIDQLVHEHRDLRAAFAILLERAATVAPNAELQEQITAIATQVHAAFDAHAQTLDDLLGPITGSPGEPQSA
jgi:hypothetical protein